MKRALHYIITLILFHCGTVVQAQWQNGLWTDKEAYNWYFGQKAGLNFDTDPPTVLTDGQTDLVTITENTDGIFNPLLTSTTYAGSSSISDSDGNLLFYTNGNVVWNKNHQIMQNGMGIISQPTVFQGTVIIKAPGNSQKYFVFSVKPPDNYALQFPEVPGDAYITPMVVYSEIDMSLDGGLGGVTENKNIMIAGFDEPCYGKITATYHADGHQIWVMLRGMANNQWKAFLVSDDGVSLTPVISNIGVSPVGYPDGSAQIKFSPDGTKIVKSLQVFGLHNVEVFNFDNQTGQVTDILVTLGTDVFIGDGEIAGVAGLEFSPNSKLLYTVGLFGGVLKQFNLEAGGETEIKASAVVLSAPLENPVYSHVLQVAPDGKIYATYSTSMLGGFNPGPGHNYLNVINNPNNIGLAADFELNAIDLQTGKTGFYLPNFVQSYFASGILYDEINCANKDVTFSTLRIPGIESIAWDFGDPDSGESNLSAEPVHAFSAGGTYTVTAIITSNGAQQTTTTQITIEPLPVAVVPATGIVKCADASGSATFNLNDFDAVILNGQNPVEFSVMYYTSTEDVAEGNSISAPETFTTIGQAIYTVVTNMATGCTTMLQFDLVVNPLPVAGTPGTFEECGNTSGTAVFDLTTQDVAILNGQSAADFTVVYYTDAAGTQKIVQPETFESAGQTVYGYVYNSATGCSVATQFELAILPLPSFPGATSFTGCSPFDLVAIVGEPAANTSYSYFANEEDALSNSNAIANASAYIIEGNTGSVYIKVLSNDGCIQVAELSLKAGNCFIPRGISPNNDTMNDTFNLSGFGVEQLEIFNRYGQQVYSKSNYTMEWHGQADNGNNLPTGTYYYMIKLSDGKSRTGWVYLNREE